MFRSILTLGVLSFCTACTALPVVAQSDAPVPSVQTDSSAASSTPATTSTKRVWTNDSLSGATATSTPSTAKKQSQKNTAASNSRAKGGDPATAARIKQSLQKLQPQLADINLKLENYKKFLEGENVSDSGRDVSKGYSRTPVEQQIPKLQEKKKQLDCR